MILGNVDAHHKGRKIRALGAQHRRLAVDFPGWGADNYADFLLPIPAGLIGVVTYVEVVDRGFHDEHGEGFWLVRDQP